MDQNNERLPVLIFTANEILYIIPLENVRYIEACPHSFTELPNSPEYVNGMCNMNGESITLINLGVLLFGERKSSVKMGNYIIVIDNTGFIVDDVLGIEQTENFTVSNAKLTSDGLIKNSYTLSPTITELYSVKDNMNVAFEPDISLITSRIHNLTV